jgi:hypothetical protein
MLLEKADLERFKMREQPSCMGGSGVVDLSVRFLPGRIGACMHPHRLKRVGI